MQGGINSLTPAEYVPMGNCKQTSFTGLNINKYRTMFVIGVRSSSSGSLQSTSCTQISNIVGAELIQSFFANYVGTINGSGHCVFAVHMLRPTSPDISYTITNGTAFGMAGTNVELNSMNKIGAGLNIATVGQMGMYHQCNRSNQHIKHLMLLAMNYSDTSFGISTIFSHNAITNTRAISPQTVTCINADVSMTNNTSTKYTHAIYHSLRTVCEVGMNDKYIYTTADGGAASLVAETDSPLIHYAVGSRKVSGVVTLELS